MLLILQLAIVVLLTLANKAFALWPIPPHMTTGTTPLKLSPTFSITTSSTHLPSDLLAAINDTATRLRTDKFQRLVVGRGAADANTSGNSADATKSYVDAVSPVLSVDKYPLRVAAAR